SSSSPPFGNNWTIGPSASGLSGAAMMRSFWRDAMRNACLSLWNTHDWFGSPSATVHWMSGLRFRLLFRGMLIEWPLWALTIRREPLADRTVHNWLGRSATTDCTSAAPAFVELSLTSSALPVFTLTRRRVMPSGGDEASRRRSG